MSSDDDLEGMYKRRSANKQESCGKAAAFLVALLGAVGYGLVEAVRYIA